MKLIRKYFLIILCILTIAGTVFCGIYLRNQVNNYKVGLTDVQGDRANLQGIKISGTVADNLHKLDFEITDGSAKTELSAITREERKSFDSAPMSELFDWIHYEYEPFEIPTEAKTVTVNEAAVTFWVSTFDGVHFSFRTDMTIKNEQYPYSFVYENTDGKIHQTSGSLSFVDIPQSETTSFVRQNPKTGKIYLFTKSGRDCAGFGGVYDITEHIHKPYTDYESVELENIAPVDLKDGNVRIIDMQINGDKMVFFIFEDGEVVLKPFDMSANRFEDDIRLGKLKFADGGCNIRNYSCVDDRYIIAAFEMKETDVYAYDNRFYTIVYDTQTERVVFNQAEERMEIYPGTYIDVKMKYKDNNLYLLRNYRRYKYSGEILSDNELRITVLDGSGTIYSGVITSGVGEDAMFGTRNQLITLQYRAYFNLALE